MICPTPFLLNLIPFHFLWQRTHRLYSSSSLRIVKPAAWITFCASAATPLNSSISSKKLSIFLVFPVDNKPKWPYITINPVIWRWMAQAIGPERAFFVIRISFHKSFHPPGHTSFVEPQSLLRKTDQIPYSKIPDL